MAADDFYVPCSQLDDGMDVGDEEQHEALQIDPPTDEPQVHFVCLYGTNHGATPSFSLPAVHGAKIELGCRVPPAPKARYASKAKVEPVRVVLTDSHDRGISRQAGYFEYDQHTGVKLVNTQGKGLPMFVNGSPIKSFGSGVVLNPSDDLELGFGGSKESVVR